MRHADAMRVEDEAPVGEGGCAAEPRVHVVVGVFDPILCARESRSFMIESQDGGSVGRFGSQLA